jgi:PST family polysaccharide transporter
VDDERTWDAPPEGSLTHRTFTAAQWRLLSSVVRASLQFGVTVLLSRLLPPKDFGLLALALVFTGLAGLFATIGLGPTIIQRRPLTPRHIRVGFTLSVLFGLATSGTLVALAPFSTLVFPNEQLPGVLRVIALVFLVMGFGNVSGALLRRSLDFRAVFVIGATSYVLGYALVATSMALAGFGVWSLAVGSVAQSVVETVLLVAIVRHPMKPLFAMREARELTGFGVGFSLKSLMTYAANKGDNFVIGRLLGADALGLYNRAYSLMTLPQDQFASVIRAVLFPAFSEIQDEPKTLARAFLVSLQLTSILAVPLLAGMIVAAPHMIVGLYGERWVGAVAPLQILCLFGLFRTYPLSGAVALAAGRVYWVTGAALLFAALVIGGGILASRWGITGVAWAVGLGLAAMYLAVSALALRIAGLRWRAFFRAQAPGVGMGALVAAVAFGVRLILEQFGLPSIVIFALLVLACALTLLSGLHLLPNRWRPAELYQKLGQLTSQLPARIRVPVRRVLRLYAGS